MGSECSNGCCLVGEKTKYLKTKAILVREWLLFLVDTLGLEPRTSCV